MNRTVATAERKERRGEGAGAARVSHVVDHYRRYPGEEVTFYTLVEVLEELSDLTLEITLPRGLTLETFYPSPELARTIPYVEVVDGGHSLVWSLEGSLPAGTRYEYRAKARLAATEQDGRLVSQAKLATADHATLAGETVAIAVRAKGRYLRYLPELYERDELMGRFLMLFESFWSPIEMQIRSLPAYFDPKLSTTRFLPWLASWLGLELDGSLSVDQQRLLIRSAFSLYRRRGTLEALRDYLEIYSGGEAEVVEHTASDFRLGSAARLGPGIALGTGNRPHTFAVNLRLPPISAMAAEGDRAREELNQRRMIEAIIEAEKPAHTSYTLRIERTGAA